jgi:hypothetical protein
MPPVSTGDYERLKNSVKEQGGLLMPVTLNQNNVVLDGHHRLRACSELGIEASYNIRDFTGREMDELKFVVSVNLHRRHLDEFQRAEIGLRFIELANEIAYKHWKERSFANPEMARKAANKRFGREMPPVEEEEDVVDDNVDETRIMHDGSLDTPCMSTEEIPNALPDTEPVSSRAMLSQFVGVSEATMARVETILDEGTEEQISELRSEKKKGVRPTYEAVQHDKLKNSLAAASAAASAPVAVEDQLSASGSPNNNNNNSRSIKR